MVGSAMNSQVKKIAENSINFGDLKMSQIMRWVMFAVTATITVVIGLAIYNRIAARVPQLKKVVG